MTHNKTDKAARKLEKKLQQAEKLRKAAENAKPGGKNPKIPFEPKLDKTPKNPPFSKPSIHTILPASAIWLGGYRMTFCCSAEISNLNIGWLDLYGI